MLEQSLETVLDTTSDSEAALTPVRAVPLTPGQLHTEVNIFKHSLETPLNKTLNPEKCV